MYKLLIVDDEKLDREGLKAQIPWDKFGIGPVELAKSGFEACRRAEAFQPDLLITDIKMPGMSGLELAEKLKKVFPDLKVIFVSGFDDFEYVRTALRLDAYEYILKPVDTLELESTILGAISCMKREESRRLEEQELRELADESREVMKQKLLSDLVYGTLKPEDRERLNRFVPGLSGACCFSTLLVEFDDYRLLMEGPEEEKAARQFERAHEFVTGFACELCRSEILALTPSRYVVLLFLEKKSTTQDIHDGIREYASRLMEGIRAETGLSITAATGKYTESIFDLYDSYHHSCTIMTHKMLMGKGTILDSVPGGHERVDSEKLFREIDKELSLYVRNNDYIQIEQLLDSIFDKLEQARTVEKKYVQDLCIHLVSCMQLILHEMNETAENVFGKGVVLWEKLFKFETILDIRNFMKNIFKAVIEYLGEKNARGTSKIIQKVQQYVSENYHREISLKEMSASFFYSPNYLGLIIKEELGKGFNEYLTEYRMKKAAELLKDPALKVYEIAEKVSYRNVTAFVNKFEQQYGLSPREYRKRV